MVSRSQVSGYVEALKKLRTREGLTVERLAESEQEFAELLDAPAVVDRARATGEPIRVALVKTVRELVTGMNETNRLVLDAVLRLRLVIDAAHPAYEDLYASGVTPRRRALLEHWVDLHHQIGVEPPRPPSDTVLRTGSEDRAFEQLAERLAVGSPARNTVPAAASPTPSIGRAIVFGGAVTDHLYRIRAPLDPSKTAVQAMSYTIQPGGKGLTLAVALARLGFKVELVAAIGDDPEADAIQSMMLKEGVGGRYLKRIREAKTPHVNVITDDLQGQSQALAWMNDEITYEPGDIANVYRSFVEPSDLVFFTLEIPFDGIRDSLRALPLDRMERAAHFLIPSPPPSSLATRILEYNVFSRLDYVIAHRWELEALVSDPTLTDTDERQQARVLLAQFGVGHVIVCDGLNDGLAVRAFDLATGEHEWRGSVGGIYRESAGAREALSAALAHQLRTAELDGQPPHLTAEAIEFGAAALAVSATQPGVTAGMPSVAEIIARRDAERGRDHHFP